MFVVASLDRPPEARLAFRGVTLEIGTALLWLLAAGVALAPGVRARIGNAWRVLAAGLPWLGAMIVSGALSLPTIQVVPYALRGWTLVAALFLGWVAFGRPERRRALEVAVGVGVLLQAGAAVGQILGGLDRTHGTFFLPTTFGAYLALVLPLAFVCANTPGPRRAVWRVIAVAATFALLSTFSRSPLLAGAAGCGVAGLGAWSSAERRPRRMLAGAAGAALLLIGLLAASATMARPGASGAADSDWRRLDLRVTGAHLLDLRLPIYRLAVDMWRDHPWLGVGGPSRYAPVAARYATDMTARYGARPDDYGPEASRLTYLTHAHQQYLQIAVTYGALGLAAWLGLLVWVVARLGARAPLERAPVAAVGAGVLVAALLHGALDLVLPALEVELGLLVGASLGPPPEPRRSG